MSTFKVVSYNKQNNTLVDAGVEKKELSVADLAIEALKLSDDEAKIDDVQALVDRCKQLMSDECGTEKDLLGRSLHVASLVHSKDNPVFLIKLLDEISSILKQKGSNKNPHEKTCALFSVAQISSITQQSSEPYLIQYLPNILDATTDKSVKVCKAAEVAAMQIIKASHSLAAGLILPILFKAMESTNKYQKRVLALNLLMILSRVSSHLIRANLAGVIPKVAECMTDMHAQVVEAAKEAMNILVKTINNRDLLNAIPYLIEATADYAKVEACVKALHETTFVRDIEAPALALIIPVLSRSLLERNNAVLYRQASVVVDNLCKLIPFTTLEIQDFLQQLVPGLERIIETGADPELRQVASKSLETVQKMINQGRESTKSERRVQAWAIKYMFKQQQQNKSIEEFVVNYLSEIVTQLTNQHNFDPEDWANLAKYLGNSNDDMKIIELMREKCFQMVKKEEEDLNKQDHEIVCNCVFNLGYGGMMLLRDANLVLRRGCRYAVVGKNGCGKTTLLRAIANGQLEGFPSENELKTVYVSHTFQALDDNANLETVSEYLLKNFPKSNTLEILDEFGFVKENLQNRKLSELSGGWKMKLELAVAMLKKADVLLLDEPTNHLDAKNCQWLEKYLTGGGSDLTVLLVSHDAGFMDAVCSHIIHYNQQQLTLHKCDFTKFTEIVPEAKSYLEYKSEEAFAFTFPDPGNLDGVKSNQRTILRLKDVEYTYPNSQSSSLHKVNLGISLSSRIAIVGPNGAGKSTMIKIMTGEFIPTAGKVQKHPSLRLAYVAQHAFHHLEQHLEKSPNAYIRWRFESNGIDKELLAKETRKLTSSEMAKKEEMNIECLCGRQKLKRSYKYEVKLVGHDFDDTVWVNRERLEELGFRGLVQAYDDYEASRVGGYQREITTAAIASHLEEFGIPPEIGTHGQIKGLSGGQKVKVVLAAAMWLKPHILVMDEPTNYLDVQSLNALSRAIKGYKGGVVIVSHNSKFVSTTCTEFHQMSAGHLTSETNASVDDDDLLEDDEKPTSTTDSDQQIASAETTEAKEVKKREPKALKKKKETRKERLAKEKIKLAKLYKYGPKADGTEYSSDEEPEVNINIGSINS